MLSPSTGQSFTSLDAGSTLQLLMFKCRYGHITSNIAESFNSAILEAREKPILQMFEHMCRHLMEWFAQR